MELLSFPDGHTLHRTFAWVVPAKSADSDRLNLTLDKIEVLIDPPAPGTPALAVPDLKAWILTKEPKPRFLTFKDVHGNTQHRRATAEAVFAGYVTAVLRRANLSLSAEATIRLLMPAIDESDVHDRYRDVLSRSALAVLPLASVEILSEPEMVLEFYRLVKCDLPLRSGKNSFFLVVDSGASTTNFTIVITTRSGEVTEARSKRRVVNLRAVSSDAKLVGGHAVDAEIFRRIAPSLSELPPQYQEEILVALERAKLLAARGGSPVELQLPAGVAATIDVAVLREMSRWLWGRLLPTYRSVAERLLSQLQRGAGALKYGRDLQEKNINEWSDVARLFDAVLLAGGTSNLPGYGEELRSSLGLPAETPVRATGGAYPVAAAVGGFAHARGQAPRAPAQEARDDESPVEFTPSIQYDILLDCKEADRPSEPARILLVDRREALAVGAIDRSVGLPTSWQEGTPARARIIPSISGDFAKDRTQRRGMGFTKLRVVRSPAEAQVFFDPESQQVTLMSEHVPDVHQLYFSGARLAAPTIDVRSQPTTLVPDTHVVVDIGMSKTVLVHAPRILPPSPDAFDRADRDIPNEAGFSLSVAPEPESIATRIDGETAGTSTPAMLVDGPGAPLRAPAEVMPGRPSTSAVGQNTAVEVGGREEPQTGAVKAEAPPPRRAAPAGGESDNGPPQYGEELTSPLELENPVERIRDMADALLRLGLHFEVRDIALLYLALCTRRFVVLAGPPGCGKSTLARTLAKLLGCVHGRTFFDISVQAHWVNDDPLFDVLGVSQNRGAASPSLTLALLDEMNLTRPEYYLARLFGAFDHHGEVGGQRIPSFGVIGTMNVDDCSRPPSPKVLDRAMLLLVTPSDAALTGDPRCVWSDASGSRLWLPEYPPPARRSAVSVGRPTESVRDRILSWISRAQGALAKNSSMRPDLIPSHRAQKDLLRFASLHSALGLDVLIDQTAAIDRAILGRFLPSLSGPASEVRTVIDEWLALSDDLPETRRRLERMKHQCAESGYVSFWQ